MYLTRKQEKVLMGEEGPAKARALEIIVRVGESLGADRLVSIRHAHVSGISYLNIGEPGLKLLEELADTGGRAEVYTTVNPSCIDLSGESLIIDNSVADKQLRINKALEKMGFHPTYTCIPYLYRPPSISEALAWGESNAVVMANSYYGARTNREGGPLALAAALTGYTYHAGLQLIENRTARVKVRVGFEPGEGDYGLIGLWLGENIEDIPVLEFPKPPSYYGLKLLFAASAATGSHGLIVVEDITPRNTYRVEVEDRVTLEKSMLEKYQYKPGRGESILGYLGCPHLHPGELYQLAGMIDSYERVRSGNALLLSIPLDYYYTMKGEIAILRRRGVDIAFGTCPIVSRLRGEYDVVLTNSGKAWFYLQKLHGFKVAIASPREIVEAVMEK